MVESVEVSLERMKVDHLDIVLCHDVEFVDLAQILNETLPALRRLQSQGKVRFVGISGYPMAIFKTILDQRRARCDPLVQSLYTSKYDARRPAPLPPGQGGGQS